MLCNSVFTIISLISMISIVLLIFSIAIIVLFFIFISHIIIIFVLVLFAFIFTLKVIIFIIIIITILFHNFIFFSIVPHHLLSPSSSSAVPLPSAHHQHNPSSTVSRHESPDLIAPSRRPSASALSFLSETSFCRRDCLMRNIQENTSDWRQKLAAKQSLSIYANEQLNLSTQGQIQWLCSCFLVNNQQSLAPFFLQASAITKIKPNRNSFHLCLTIIYSHLAPSNASISFLHLIICLPTHCVHVWLALHKIWSKFILPSAVITFQIFSLPIIPT